MIKPTVGRMIWYIPHPKDNMEQHGDDPLAAIIVAVHNDQRINIVVWGAFGNQRFLSRALLWQEEQGDRPKHGYACWMPYQIGQAAKTEQLQSALNKGSEERVLPADPRKTKETPAVGTGG